MAPALMNQIRTSVALLWVFHKSGCGGGTFVRRTHVQTNEHVTYTTVVLCFSNCGEHNTAEQRLLLLLLLLLFTAVGFAPGGSSPALVQTKTLAVRLLGLYFVREDRDNMFLRNVSGLLLSYTVCTHHNQCCKNLRSSRVTVRGAQFCPAHVLVVNNGYTTSSGFVRKKELWNSQRQCWVRALLL
jgi:hypothetical protein